MHGFPGMPGMGWWHARRAARHCGADTHEHAGPRGPGWGGPPGGGPGGWGPPGGGGPGPGGFGGHDGHDERGGGPGGFGVRRPLRFLAFKLELDEHQVAELARILNDLKTERAQAAVDDRRTVSAFAEAISDGTWDEAKALAAAELRVKSAQGLKDAVVKALGRIHALLETGQREKIAYLIRTGTLSI
jgi:Spy/CpxP family protein refolding chaperone